MGFKGTLSLSLNPPLGTPDEMLHTLSPLKTYGERRGTEEFRLEASATLAHGCKQQGLNGCTGDFGHYYLLASTSPKTAIDFIREL